jgi:hypothetical protein
MKIKREKKDDDINMFLSFLNEKNETVTLSSYSACSSLSMKLMLVTVHIRKKTAETPQERKTLDIMLKFTFIGKPKKT